MKYRSSKTFVFLTIMFSIILETCLCIINLEQQISNLKQQLQGKRVGFLTNPTGVNNRLNMLIDEIYEDKSIQLKCFFAPEHGLRGNQQAGLDVQDYIDPITGLPVYSLYGTRKAPTPEQLNDIDILVYYIQDTGTRFYTYIWTLTYAMQACQEQGKTVIIFDRPNPLNGDTIEGCPNTVDADYVGRVFPGQKFGIPQRYGMTIGEFARFVSREWMKNSEYGDLDLINIDMIDYNRNDFYENTGQIWIMPSPNMPTLNTAMVYPGVGIFEGSNISEGRGTTKPFEIVGGPQEHVEAYNLAQILNDKLLPGVIFRPAYFNPTFSKFKGEECGGVEITVTDRNIFESVKTGAEVMKILINLYPDEFEVNNGANRLFGIKDFNELISDKNVSVDQILESCANDLDEFQIMRKRNLIYEKNNKNSLNYKQFLN